MALKAMRCGSGVLALALIIGTNSASAQFRSPDAPAYPFKTEKPAAKPAPKEAAKKPKTGPSAPQAATAKPAAPDSAAKTGPVEDVFAGIPRDERLKIQAALLWSGDYTGSVKSDDPMLTAIKNFQKRSKDKITGRLSAEERARLLAAARDHEQEFGWRVVADPATGIRIGLPTKMVPDTHEAAHGTRWSSRHGDIQVETFRFNETGLTLPELFKREKNEPRTRRPEYSVLRDDSFFISGLQGLKKFSVRAQMRNGEVRGFTMLFDQAMEGIVAPVMVAMASAFSPFPQHSAPFARLSKTVEYGNGLIVSARGHIVTDARLTQGCQVIVAAGLGDADRVADDKEKGLALLRVYGPRQFKPLALPRGITGATSKAVDEISELTLAGMPDPKEQNAGRKLTEIKARLVDGNAIELHQPVPMAGFSGAAAIDGLGRYLGMAEMRNTVLASNGPALPPMRLVHAAAIRDFLDANHVPAVPTPAANARDSIVRIICVRK